LAGILRVSSRRAAARSFAGSLPQFSATSFTFLVSTWPVPLAVPPWVSCCGLLDLSVPGELPGCPPLGQAPPFGQDPPDFCLFSISLIISSRRTRTSFCIF
jgi:hypothetical protein